MKKTIKERIYRTSFNGDMYDVRFSDLPKGIRPTDIIEITREEPYYSENNSWDAYTELSIYREREETDEEYEKRTAENEWHAKELKKRRYENYLKLKKEFEPKK